MIGGAKDSLGRVAHWARGVDRSPRVIEAARRVRNALPGDPTFGDPLSTAGPGAPRMVARVTDRLQNDSPGAAREVGLGALQVWQSVLERAGRGRGERDVTIVFTDLVGFSTWSLAAGDADTLVLLRRVARAIETPMQDHGGRIVKRLGDGVMVVFTRADQAVAAVRDAKNALDLVELGGYQPRMRVGIHTGCPRAVGADWLGVDVTVAARVMQTGADGNVMMSNATLAALSPDALTDLGLTVKPYRRGMFAPKLTGVPDDLRIFRIVEAPER
ncbi:adenylate/guanylate cyclase domain-containing protein [Rhodococcoides trifolii]|uniref:adenylate/guanylate cyclase domain-containing protein n=1 Tax=Rhodococcoides trifolii TaxID=908250 RepID=UPI001E28B8E8|nr:adenylate/guanylate cyclase domain-containing protein [Rhodococcus trifolii]